jgi:monoterpene epsilon-lactone hydrolase
MLPQSSFYSVSQLVRKSSFVHLFILIKLLFNLVYFVFYCFPPIKNTSRRLSALLRTLLFAKRFQKRNTSIQTLRFPFLLIMNHSLVETFQKDYLRIQLQHSTLYKLEHAKSRRDNKTCILYVHGGGFCTHDFQSYKSFCQHLVNQFEMDLFFPQYRLCPEVCVDEALSDVKEGFHAVFKTYDKVVLMGDSAGGCLSILLVQQMNQDDRKKMKALVLFSPVVDLKCGGESFQKNKNECILSDELCLHLFSKVVQWSYNPLEKSFEKFPPTFINCASNELFYTDSCKLYKELQTASCPSVQFYVNYAFHAYPLFFKYCKEGEEAVDKAKQFVLQL